MDQKRQCPSFQHARDGTRKDGKGWMDGRLDGWLDGCEERDRACGCSVSWDEECNGGKYQSGNQNGTL